MTKHILAFMFVAFLTFPVLSSAEDATTVTTKDEQLAWMQDAFDKHVTDIILRGDKVWFQTDGFFVQEEGTEQKKEFLLGVSDAMMHPDDHGTIVLTVQNIDDEGVTLVYESTFDHRSFGHDKITKDEGQFKIFWRKSDGQA